jgi:hypothetical protein
VSISEVLWWFNLGFVALVSVRCRSVASPMGGCAWLALVLGLGVG